MFEVYLRKSNEEENFLINCADFKAVNDFINSYIKRKDFPPSHYYRMWIQEPGCLMIDFGSWSNFFVVKGPVEEVLSQMVSGE